MRKFDLKTCKKNSWLGFYRIENLNAFQMPGLFNDDAFSCLTIGKRSIGRGGGREVKQIFVNNLMDEMCMSSQESRERISRR